MRCRPDRRRCCSPHPEPTARCSAPRRGCSDIYKSIGRSRAQDGHRAVTPARAHRQGSSPGRSTISSRRRRRPGAQLRVVSLRTCWRASWFGHDRGAFHLRADRPPADRKFEQCNGGNPCCSPRSSNAAQPCRPRSLRLASRARPSSGSRQDTILTDVRLIGPRPTATSGPRWQRQVPTRPY